MVSIILYLGILAAIVAGIVKAAQSVQGRGRTAIEGGRDSAPSLPGGGERVFVYALSFAGFMAVLFALAGLAALIMVPVVPGARALISNEDIQVRTSYYLAALIIGAPLWLGLWRLAQRRVVQTPAERHAIERRLFLAATFGVTAVVALFGLQEFLQNSLALFGSQDHGPHTRDTIIGAAQFLTYGTAWILYARLGWRERRPGAIDWTHDVAVYAISVFALIFVFVGATGMATRLLSDLNGTATLSFGSAAETGWQAWSGPVAWAVVGLVASIGMHRYDAARGGVRFVRVVYEYGMLLWVVSTTLYGSLSFVYEALRRAFGYHIYLATWTFLADDIPLAVVGLALWIYLWALVRREAALHGESGNGGLRYPRRIPIATLSFVGLTITAVGVVATLWVVIDALVGTHHAPSAGTWWRDSLSMGLAGLTVGGLLWVPSWYLLQRAATRRPDVERAALERRLLTGGIALIASAFVLGFSVAALYEIWRTVLGAGGADALRTWLHFIAADATAAAIALYFGLLFRADSRYRAAAPAKREVRLSVLLAPDGKHMLDDLIQGTAIRAEIVGYLLAEPQGSLLDLPAVRSELMALGGTDGPGRALLILGATGGILYPYSREVMNATVDAPVRESAAPAQSVGAV